MLITHKKETKWVFLFFRYLSFSVMEEIIKKTFCHDDGLGD